MSACLFRHMILFLLLAGCATPNESIAPRVDEVRGETIVTLRDPLVLARRVPHLSIAARDYMYLGPVEIDRMGAQEFYLWVGMASTIDCAIVGKTLFAPDEVDLFIDGSTLSLPLTTWPHDSEVSPYSVTTPLYRSLRARVKLVDLERISRAEELSAELTNTSGESARYQFWSGRMPAWTVLARDTEVVFRVQVQSRSSAIETNEQR